ncbi:hypothetical protein BDW02DRAFT_615241 [Decorospora gaudefroyi]|uniref:Uncharacterized protein n=1 Tax=Decorospora gaudefroyi TaxID=184978 RepID=A0A6A5KKW3_9PLEO|nr:hypothetical protein BDW02DRAFT_615241 [Decorospora gaudefroyi]
MDFDGNPDEPPGDRNYSALLSATLDSRVLFWGYFGDELLGSIMAQTIATWTIDEFGYTCDAPHVHVDGRMEGALHPPAYYAYPSPTGSWDDGLEAIESFDWSTGKEKAIEQGTSTGEGEAQSRAETPAAEYPDLPPPISPEEQLSLGGVNVTYPEPTSSRLDVKLDHDVQSPSFFSVAIVNPSTHEVKSADTTRIPSVSPPWIPSPCYEQVSTSSGPPLRPKSDTGSNAAGQDQDNESLEDFDIDGVFLTAMGWDLESEIETVRESVAQEDVDTIMDIAGSQNEEPVAGATDIEENSRVDGEEVEHFVPEVATSSTAEIGPNNATVEEPGREFAENPQLTAAVSHVLTEEPIWADSYPDLSTASELFREVDTARDSAHIYIEAATPTLPQEQDNQEPADGPVHDERLAEEQQAGDVTQPVPLESFSRAQTKEGVSPGSTEVEVPTAIKIGSEAPVEALTDIHLSELEALIRADAHHDKPWQAQLQEAANHASPNCSSELLPPEHRDPNTGTPEATFASILDEVLEEVPVPSAGALLEQHRDSNVELPPSPLQASYNVGNIEEVDDAIVADEEDYTGAQHAGIIQQSRFELPSPKVDAIDETIASGPESALAAVKGNDVPLTGNDAVSKPSLNNGDSTSADQLKTSVSKANANPRKRSKPTKKAKATSDTEEEAPPKKKPRRAAPAKPRASRAKKAPRAPEEERGNDLEGPPTKRKRRPAKAKKEGSDDDELEHDATRNQNGLTSELAHSAYGNYNQPASQPGNPTDPSGETIFGTEPQLQAPDNDGNDVAMEEHWSEFETPAPAVPHTPKPRYIVSNRELANLSATKYRERSSRTCAIAFKKPAALRTLTSSPKGLEASPAIVPQDANAIEEETSRTLENSLTSAAPPIGKSNGGAPKKAQRQRAKRTVTRRDTRNKMKGASESDEEEEEEESELPTRATKKKEMDPVEEEEEHEFFPAPKIQTDPNREEEEEEAVLSPPPKPSTRKTRRKPIPSQQQPIHSPTNSFDDAEHDQSEDPPATPSPPPSPSPSSESESEHVSYSSDDELAPSPPTKRIQKKKNPTTASLANKTVPKSRAATPAPVTTSLPLHNKYGFTPPRGPKTRSGTTTTATTATATPVPTAKRAAANRLRGRFVKSKGKGKGKEGEMDKESEKESRTGAGEQFKAKLRGKGV